jgi:NAD(P)-dependent dehydrogenase (short-subunit alcohol dehydrogenase family)
MIRSVLITGAGKRIGRQLALDLADDGWDVAVHCNRSAADGEEVAQIIRGKGRRACVVVGDLSDDNIAETLLAKTAAGLGPLTALINSASMFEADEVGELTIERWQQQLDVNLRAPVMLAQAFARQLPVGEKGNIINLIDQRVWKLNPQFFSYTISKSGLWTATRTLAQALAPHIRVNAIGPGPALPSVRMEDEDFEKQKSRTLLGIGTSPSEISQAAKFLLSQPAITGQMIALDGGQHLVWKTADVVEVNE